MAFAVRFVLHPAVSATLGKALGKAFGEALQTVDLTLSNGDRWRFSAQGHALSVEGAVYRDGLRTIPTLQILVLATTDTNRSLGWDFRRLDEAEETAAAGAATEAAPPAPRRRLADALAEVQLTPTDEPQH